jgi:hypothetical protein
MVRKRAKIGMAVLTALLGGCASAQVGSGTPLAAQGPPPTAGMVTGGIQPAGYQLSKEEEKYDCRKLTGTMQIRILQIRGQQSQNRASVVARSLQSLATPIFGGSKEGVDPDAQYARDRAMLEAYNRQLASKRCPTFDLDTELAETRNEVTPTPRDGAVH